MQRAARLPPPTASSLLLLLRLLIASHAGAVMFVVSRAQLRTPVYV